MLNICFSETALGMLEYAVSLGYLIESDCVCIPDDLSLGDISNPRNFESRRDILLSLYHDPDYVERSCRKRYHDFYTQVANHDKVIIWYANMPEEYCGLLYTLWLLKDAPAEIKSICCSRTLKRGENQYISYYSTADVPPEGVIRFLPFEKCYTKEEKEELVLEWEKLSDENGALRVYWNQNIQTADICYYDNVILKYVPHTPQLVGEFISSFINGEHYGIHREFIRYRIRALAQKGLLTLQGEGKEKKLFRIEQKAENIWNIHADSSETDKMDRAK